MTRNSRRDARRRLLLGVLLALGVLAAIELLCLGAFRVLDAAPFAFARLADERAAVAAGSAGGPAPSLPEVPAAYRSRALHPYVGYVASPDAPPQLAHGAPADAINRYGYPTPRDPIRVRSPEKVIVAILGGSVAGGLASAGAPHIEEVLSASPRFAGRSFEFVPLALAGYKQPQQLMTLAYLLSLGAEFDLALNLDGFNEVALHPAENARTGTFAAFPRWWALATGELSPRALAAYELERAARTRLAAFHSAPLLRHSVLANLIWRLRDRRAAARVRAAGAELVDRATADPSYERTGPPRRYADEDEMMDHLAAIWRDSSLQLARLARANGIAYYHFLQPNQYATGSKPLSPHERRRAYDPDHPYRRGAELGYPRLSAAGAELVRAGVAFRDLSRVFADREETLYADDCCHYTRAGYEIVADAIARAILETQPAATPLPGDAEAR